jgi:hypothetical protein
MAAAPRTLQRMPESLSRWPTTARQPASTTWLCERLRDAGLRDGVTYNRTGAGLHLSSPEAIQIAGSVQ